jgi:two-component system response regulator HydG
MKPPDALRVLVADDNLEMARMLCDGLADQNYDAVPFASGRQAIERLTQEHFDAVVTDLRMPDADGLEVLAAARKLTPERPVIVMTAYSAVDTAIESIRRGAYHYLTKPFKTEELVVFLGRALDEASVRREARALRTTLRDRFSLAQVVGESKSMARLHDLVKRVAKSDVPVLITGETGTGKGLIARALHAESERSGSAFVTVNCAALPDQLLESELFGHVKGAFTGAVASRPGLFAEAHRGTLFLDEIGDLPMSLQSKLLDVLERGIVRPVGSEKEHAVDVRIIAATNRDLREAVRTGAFREDLLYRLDVVPIEVPPLRFRRDDILALLDHFMTLARKRHASSPVVRFAREAVDALLGYAWPGNVRELEHMVERLVVLGTAPEIDVPDLPRLIRERASDPDRLFHGEIVPIRELERRYAAWALEQMGGHRGKTAERLGIDEKTLWRWLSERSTPMR